MAGASHNRAEVDAMGRVGCFVMLLGFVLLWSLPVAGTVVMVTGAVTAAISWESTMLDAEGASTVAAAADRPAINDEVSLGLAG